MNITNLEIKAYVAAEKGNIPTTAPLWTYFRLSFPYYVAGFRCQLQGDNDF